MEGAHSPRAITLMATRTRSFQTPLKTSPKHPEPSFLQSLVRSLPVRPVRRGVGLGLQRQARVRDTQPTLQEFPHSDPTTGGLCSLL